jgi:ubiquitin-conjugating enzyme E2 variant
MAMNGKAESYGIKSNAASSFLASEDKAMKKEFLKTSYGPLKRTSDILWSLVFGLLFFPSVYNIASHTTLSNLWIGVIAFIGAMLASDFFSALTHWSADTWGTFETPFLGPTFIRSFREHHISPTAMTHHDVFECNGDSCLLVTPLLIVMLRKNIMLADGSIDSFGYFTMAFWTWTCIWVAFTNQFHSWAHQKNAPAVVKFLQKYGVILSPDAHRKHHQIPFDRNYCITNGWMDAPLAYINFWRRFEALFSALTGMVPREDDYKWNGLLDSEPETVKLLKAGKKPEAVLQQEEHVLVRSN